MPKNLIEALDLLSDDLSLTAFTIAGLAFADGRTLICAAAIALVFWGRKRRKAGARGKADANT